MKLEFNCPSCLKKLRVPNRYAGRQVKCPSCAHRCLVPKSRVVDRTETQLPRAGRGSDRREVERVECPCCAEWINPAAIRCPYCRSRVGQGSQTGWRDGRSLVMVLDRPLPPVCVKTGKSEIVYKTMRLSCRDSSGMDLALLGLLAFGWLVTMTPTTVELQIPFSKEYFRRRVLRFTASIALIVLGACLGIGPIVLRLPDAEALPIVLAGAVLGLTGLIAVVAFSNIVTAKRITDDYVWIAGAGSAYLDSLPIWDGIE